MLDYVLQVADGTMHDPVMIQTRGRPTRSTRRDPSLFERVSNQLGALLPGTTIESAIMRVLALKVVLRCSTPEYSPSTTTTT